jgi:hypothetical protein
LENCTKSKKTLIAQHSKIYCLIFFFTVSGKTKGQQAHCPVDRFVCYYFFGSDAILGMSRVVTAEFRLCGEFSLIISLDHVRFKALQFY